MTCSPFCGDGKIIGHEACDDGKLEIFSFFSHNWILGNTISGDGCDSQCLYVESGFNCTDQPSQCSAFCGDGVRVGDEECDDGSLLR